MRKMFYNGITEGKIKKLPTQANFDRFNISTKSSRTIITEAVRVKIKDPNEKKAHYIEGVFILNLINANASFVDAEGCCHIKINMHEIAKNISEERRNAAKFKEEGDMNNYAESTIKCIYYKYIYTHYAKLFENLTPEFSGRVF